MKFILNYRTVWLVFFGTDSSATVVPIGAIQWYRFADIINEVHEARLERFDSV